MQQDDPAGALATDGPGSIGANLRLLALAFSASLALILTGCAGLPPRGTEIASHALSDGADTALGRTVQRSMPPGYGSGFQLLPDASQSYQKRLDMIDHAQRSIDLQTFLLRADNTGHDMVRALSDAGARGVRVRVLIDDLNTAGTDEMLLALAAAPNVQVRLFNPFVNGRSSLAARVIESLPILGRMNHRMHNKLLVADNAVAIFGGRNLGDDYFSRAAAMNFVDFDVLGAGKVVRDLSLGFDDYWNSEFAYPLAALVASRSALAATAASKSNHDANASSAALDSRRQGAAEADLATDWLRLTGAAAEVKTDRLDKIAGSRLEDPSGTVRAYIGDLMHAATREILLITPYYVPGKESMQAIRKLRAAGVRLRVLTNSLAATDEPMVHGGYLRYRRELLELGVELYEMSPTHSIRLGDPRPKENSVGSLHAKVIVVDRTKLFVGSMNLDVRSERYNAELGVVLDSPELAAQFLQLMDFAGSAYQLRLNPKDQRVEWVAPEGAEQRVFTSEPEASWWLQLKAQLLGPLIPEGWL